MRASNKKRLATLERKATPAPAHTKVLGFAPVAQNDEQHPDQYLYRGQWYTEGELSNILPKRRFIIVHKSYGPLDQDFDDDDQE